MKFLLRLLVLALCISPFPVFSTEPDGYVEISDNRSTLGLFSVEIADTPLAQETGLMHRKTLPEKHGMLFMFPTEARRSFWMKDTLIPLDILFIDAAGVIVHIAESTTPLSEDAISSVGRAKAVLEVAGGTSQSFGIRPGNRVKYTLLRTSR